MDRSIADARVHDERSDYFGEAIKVGTAGNGTSGSAITISRSRSLSLRLPGPSTPEVADCTLDRFLETFATFRHLARLLLVNLDIDG
jgi:hypothetical protein